MHAFKFDLMTVLVLTVIIGIVLTMSLGVRSGDESTVAQRITTSEARMSAVIDPVEKVKFQGTETKMGMELIRPTAGIVN